MRKKKIWIRMTAVCLATGMVLVGIGGCGKKNGSSNSSSNSSSSEGGTNVRNGAFALEVKFKEEDLDDSWKEGGGTNISLNGGEVAISGSGASAEGGKVTIKEAGTYVLSGSLSDGQILVEAGDEDLVKLVLNGVSVSCSDSAPVYVKNADKTVLVLAEGSENTITDGTDYVLNEEEEPNAALFSKDDLTINGTGKLTVKASYNNGIGCKDDLKLVNGQIAVEAKNHGIKGNDSVAVQDGSYSVTAGGTGIKTTNDTDSDKGYIYAEGGTFTIQSEDDGLHSNNMIAIAGGSFTINTGDDAVHSDKSLTITDGTIDVTSSYEGLESEEIYIEGGDIKIIASDDGINAAGGELESNATTAGGNIPENGTIPEGTAIMKGGNVPKNGTMPEEGTRPKGGNIPQDGTMPERGTRPEGDFPNGGQRRGMNGEMGGGMMEDSSGYLFISGGNIYVNADGDGLDSNTDVEMSGGYVVIDGPVNDGNGALDYGNRFVVTGGTLIATGSSGMAAVPTEETTVNTIFTGFNSAAAGSCLQILDSNGKEVLNITPAKTYSSLVFSSDALKSGETYTVAVDGETVAEFTMDAVVTKAVSGSRQNSGIRGGK